MGWFSNFIKNPIGTVKDTVSDVVDTVVDVVEDVVDLAVDIVGDIISWVIDIPDVPDIDQDAQSVLVLSLIHI